MILGIHTKRQCQTASGRVSRHHNLVRLVIFLVQQPFVGIYRILNSRRERILRCHPVIDRKDIRTVAELRIFYCKSPVNVLHRSDVAAAVEKGKSAFVGPELYRKTLGVIGLGAIGALVCNIGLDLGMDVYGYDPYLSVDAALRLDRHVHVVKDVNELYKVSDYVTIHVPYTSSTKDFINGDAIAKMKGGVRILNLARGELVCDQDMIAALETGRVAKYVTDFPNDTIATVKNVIAMPHLGASTPESEENCAVMAARQLQDYLVNGNIRNSVNLPNLEQEWSGISRLCLIHKNVPAMLTNIMSTLSNDGINVENMTNKSKKDYAYTIVDVNTRITDQVANELRAIPGVIRVRVLNH